MATKLCIFSVKDVKAELFSNLSVSLNRGTMMRSLSDVLRDGSHPYGKHPEDYVLYELGSYDDSNGVITPLEVPTSVCLLSDLILKGGN